MKPIYVGPEGAFFFTVDGNVVYEDVVCVAPVSYRKATDHEIVLFWRRRDRVWKLVLDNIKLIRWVAWKMHTQSDAGLMVLLRCAFRYDPSRGAFTTYATRALRNAYMRQRFLIVLEPKDQAVEHDHDDLLQYIWKQLNHKQRHALHGRFYVGLTYRQLAKKWSCSQATAMTRVKQALQVCKEIADEETSGNYDTTVEQLYVNDSRTDD